MIRRVPFAAPAAERVRYPALAYLELDNLFRDLLAYNRGPGYGVFVLGATSDLSVIDVDLRFVAGRTYCCAEPGCHLPTDTGQLGLHRIAADDLWLCIHLKDGKVQQTEIRTD